MNEFFCKTCGNKIDITKPGTSARKKYLKGISPIYCCNACKFSDKDYNLKRGRRNKINNDNFIVKCNYCDFESKDVLNLSGALTRHLKNKHNLANLKDNKHFSISPKKNNNVWTCEHCGWQTIDVDNKSGQITVHLKKYHNIDIIDSNIFNVKYEKKIERKLRMSKSKDNYIECMLCGEKLYSISYSHLKFKHNITIDEYKKMFNEDSIYSLKSKDILSKSSNNPEIKQKTVKNILKTNILKYGANSYTQSEKGKKRLQKINFNNSYDRYITSEKIAKFVKLLFKKDDYKGNKEEYDFECVKCGNVFKGKIEYGRIPRCEICYPKLAGTFNSEKEVVNFLQNELKLRNIKRNVRLEKREIDILLEDFNIGIEYNGLYWHSEIGGNKNKDYHLSKTNICLRNNIRLIHIFEDEWLVKNDIVKSRLKTILNLADHKLYARKCILKNITKTEKKNFLDTNHLQGDGASSINLGLFFENELVSVMTFAKPRFNKEYDFELTRFANKLNYNIVGSFSKLLSYFTKSVDFNSLISYADRRWSDRNNVYERNGFILVSETEPSPWYIDHKSFFRNYRFSFRKGVLEQKLKIFDKSLTEWENMQLNGYDRIWDCGTFKYAFYK